MKIVKLTAENVKRLTAIEVTPEGTLIKVGGKNGAGKTSVLDSIAYALGGEKLVPSEPIRKGEAEAKIVVDLGDLVVARRFYREKLPCDCEVQQAGEHTAFCASKKFGATKSTLVVTNKDGAKYPSPQAVLDRLLGKLTFDPLQFAMDGEKKQDETLRKLVGLDFSVWERERKEAYDRRGMAKKALAIAEVNLKDLQRYPDAPEAEISVDEISKEMKRGKEFQERAEEAHRAVEKVEEKLNGLIRSRVEAETLIRELEQRLSGARSMLKKVQEDIDGATKEAEGKVRVFEEARSAVPNFEDLDTRLNEIDVTNHRVRANVIWSQQAAKVERLKTDVKKEDAIIQTVDESKEKALQAAQFPVPGLGLSDDGVTFNGIPFGQASNAEQIRVSVAIGLALNPTLKVLLIRNGNTLDTDSLRAITEQAGTADAQLWMEWVAESKDGVAVMLQDGAVI